LVVALIAGTLLVIDPWLAFALLGLALAALVVESGTARLAVVVVGGLVVLGSTEGLSLPKVAYLGLVLLAVTVAFLQLKDVPWSSKQPLAPLAAAGLVLLAVVCFSFLVAHSQGTSISDWARDSIPYALLALAPLLAIDAAANVSYGRIIRLFVATGSLAGVSLAVTWIERRGLSDLPLDQLFFPSIGLTSALLIYALAEAQLGHRHSTRWVALAGALLALTLVTGTRTNLFFLLAPFVIALVGRQGMRSAIRLTGSLGALVLIALALSVVIGKATGTDTEVLSDRLTSVSRIESDPVAGQSWRMRVEQTELAWKTFTDNLGVGVGPGHRFPYLNPFGTYTANYFLDTPAVFPAKFGLIGLLTMALLALAYTATIGRLRRASDTTRAAVVAFLVVWVLTLPLGFPLEEKGFSFGLIFLLALALSSMRRAEPPTSLPRGRRPAIEEPQSRPVELDTPQHVGVGVR
jgi:hypothetical protein